tara:strand:- start:6506 stop:6676 length:171 start_codon:yes stop_codon:yes gene_type:complete
MLRKQRVVAAYLLPADYVGQFESGSVILTGCPLPCFGKNAFAHAENVRFPPLIGCA